MAFEIVHGSSPTSIEDAITNAIQSSHVGDDHLSAEVTKIVLDQGGGGGKEYHVKVRITS